MRGSWQGRWVFGPRGEWQDVGDTKWGMEKQREDSNCG